MRKQQRAALVAQRLADLYPNPPIPLDHQDAFTLLVAVVLSAQCTDKKVNQITPALFRVGGTPQAMAALEISQILEIIRPLGLAPQKAKALKGLAEAILSRFDGKVPNNFEDLESLPGVGHKTASVVMSQIFEKHAFPVDTHIHRLAHRWGLSDGSSVVRTERDLKKLFPPESCARPTPADHLLWPRALHRPRLRWHPLPAVPRTLPQPPHRDRASQISLPNSLTTA